MSDFDDLKLNNQLCFLLYVCSKEIISKYKPFLDELDLTYTQYITMLVLWENKKMVVNELGKFLYLDSGTLTPLLKKLEAKGFLKRNRSKKDERKTIIELTKKGIELKEIANTIPSRIADCINIENEDAEILFALLNKIRMTL